MNIKYSVAAVLVTGVILFSVFLPEKLLQLSDKTLLDTVQKEDGYISSKNFRYSLATSERLYIIAMALGNRSILQSDYAASLREKAIRANRNDTVASFAYVENSRGVTQNEISAEKAMETCNTELASIIKEGLGIDDFEIKNTCKQTLYSAVDMLDLQKNVSVWQIEYDSDLPPSGLSFSLMEAYVDAETGKVYSFSFRLDEAIDFNPDKLAKAWLERLNISDFEDITKNSHSIETAKLYKKFATEGMDYEKTVFTAGFYEGINEIFVVCY